MALSYSAVNLVLSSMWFIVLIMLSEAGAHIRCTILQGPSERANRSDLTLTSSVQKRVICQPSPPIYNITASLISDLPKGTVSLDLSGNKVTTLETSAFEGLTALRKLNLSGNPITGIQSKSFNGLDNLEKLDLSGMQLSFLNASMFEGMPKLKRLYLNGATIQRIQPGTFDVLPALTRLDLQTDLLVCDCHLQWMITWNKDWKGRLEGSAVCAIPSEHKGKLLKNLTNLVCDSPLELTIELTPSTNQIVFAGDKLPFQCRTSHVDPDMAMSWVHDDKPVVSNRTLGVFVHTERPDRLLITTLVLERLAVTDSGTWKCLVESARGIVSKLVKIVVLADNTGYCSSNTTETSRGMYVWAKTLAGTTQSVPCVLPTSAPHGSYKANARHSCDGNGLWTELDVSRCPYLSEVTRDLEIKSRMSANRSCQVACVKQVLAKVNESGRALGNVEDVIFLSHIISNLSKNIRNIELAKTLVELSSSVMDMHSDQLIAAQKVEQACSRIVKAVEEMTEHLLQTKQTIDLHSKNIAIQAYKIQPYLFAGINCTSWIGSNQTLLDRQFICDDRAANKSQFDASIAIPTDVMKQIQCASNVCPQNDTIRIQAIMYSNAKLFPVDETVSPFKVTSAVIACRIAGARLVNSSSRVTVAMLSRRAETSKLPVHWDFNANREQGAWISTGCELTSDASSPVLTFKCNHLTNFAVAEGQLPPLTGFQAWLLSLCNTSAITYLGSAVLITCLSTVFVVYIVHHRSIQMSRKMRHAIANLCLCVVLLCVVYTFGIRLHHLPIPCRITGVAIHYLSLCTLFWITAITFKILHQLSKQLMPQLPPEELSGEPPKPKPIIAGYLLGWGVAIIICGISGAINWANYERSKKYCFLSMDAALTTVFVPAGILGFFNIVLFLRIFCLIQRIPSPTPSSATMKTSADEPGLEEVQDNEIRLLSSNQTTNSGTDTTQGSNRSCSPFASRSSPVDKAYGPGSQQFALVLVLVLYCSTWLFGALAVSLPFKTVLPHHDVTFQCLYAVLASTLGAFMLVFYCIGRKDVRSSCCSNWSLLNRWNYVPANGTVVSKSPMEEPATSEIPLGAETASMASKSVYSNGVDGNKVSSTVAMPQPAAGLEQSFTAVVDSSIFYNPHQNGIAKKYWERSKRKRGVHLRKEVVGGSPVDDIELSGKCNGNVTAGQGFGCLSSDFCAELELQVEQAIISSGHEKLPVSKTEYPVSIGKPPLPVLLSLLPQDLQTNNETFESPTDLELSTRPCQNELISLPNGIKHGRLPTEGMVNLNRTRDSFHEPIENGFLEQLELRIPQQAVLVKALPPKSVFPAKEKNVGSSLMQNVDNVSASGDQKPSLTVISDRRENDLNGNKGSHSPGVKQTGTSNCQSPSTKTPLQTGGGCSLSITDSPKMRSQPDEGTLSEEGALDIWEEQQKADLKIETSV